MNQFLRVSAAAFVGTTLMLASMSSHALGFGRPTSQAILGESLTLTVPLRLEAGEEVKDECVSAEVLFGDERVAASAVNVSLLSSGAERRLRVTTSALVNEPIVTINLKAGCGASITRKFVVLADPPELSSPTVATAPRVPLSPEPPPRMPAPRNDAPGAASANAGAGAVPPVRTAPAPRVPRAAPERQLPRAEDLAASGQPSRSSRQRQAAVAPAEQPRLLLDPASIDALVVPDLRISTMMPGAAAAETDSPEVLARRQAAAALWRAMNASPDQVARDQQRVQELEQRLAQLNQESDRARESVAAMQERVRAMESSRAGNVWMYVLAAVALAAVAAAVYLYLQLRRQSANRDAWWQSQVDELQADASADAPDADPGQRTAADFVHRTGPVPMPEPDSHADNAPTAESPQPAEPVSPVPVPAAPGVQAEPEAPPMRPAAAGAQAAPAPVAQDVHRAVSVEELIDLEQQADFFVVLGQDDAAIDLLESHIEMNPAASPLPFLKLLEIYQRLGKRGDYERVQAAFNARFNAYAPAWEADLQQGHTLEDYPGVVDRLQTLWAAPVRAMEVLEKSLTRPDQDVETFDLPAYRELLFLYAVARDLAEKESHQQPVDLLLPVDGHTGLPVVAVDESSPDEAPVEPLMATRPIKAQPEARPDFTLDLQLDDLPASSSLAAGTAFTTTGVADASDHEHIDLPDVGPGRDKV